MFRFADMLIALRKYASIVMLITMSIYLVCVIADDFDNIESTEIELLTDTEPDDDDFDDNDPDDFFFDGITPTQIAFGCSNNSLLCGKEQTAAKRSSVQMSGLTHSLAPNKGNNSASYYSEIKGGVDCGSHHLFLYQFINLKFLHNEKNVFNCVFGAGFRTKRMFR